MQDIKSKASLQIALKRLNRFNLKEVHYRGLTEKYRRLVVQYMQRKNKKLVEDEEGNRWQKRQPTKLLFPDNASGLKKLLKAKGVNDKEIIKKTTQVFINVDEDAVLKLLKDKVITAAELEKVIIRQKYTAYIARMRDAKGPKKEFQSIGSSKVKKKSTRSRG